MNNRLAMAVAVAGGYVLGRTKKGKLALGLGGMVMGKRLNMSPQALTRLVSEQVLKNPQLKEVGDQVREDLRGVGKAATGAVVTRRIDSLADALHERTLNVQDQLSGAVPEEARLDKRLGADDEAEEEQESTAGRDEEERAAGRDEGDRSRSDDGGREKRRPAARTRKTAGKTAGKGAQTATRTAPGKAAPATKKRTAANKTTAARGTSDRSKGGEGRE